MLHKIGRRESQVLGLIHLGEIAQYRGQKRTAEERFREALAITRQAYDRQREGVVLAHMADLALSFNQIKAAYNLCQKALVIAQEVQDRRCECETLNCVGRIMQTKRRFSDAEKYYKDAFKIAIEAQDKREESRAEAYLGEIAEENGQIEKAEEYYRKALKVLTAHTRTIQDAMVYAEVALKLGGLLCKHEIQPDDKPDEGCGRIKEAIQLYTSMALPNEQKARRILKNARCESGDQE